MGNSRDNIDAQFPTHCHNILISDSTEWFGILFECQIGGSPFFEKLW